MVRGKCAVRVLVSGPRNIAKAPRINASTITPGMTNRFTAPMSATHLRGRGEVLDIGVEPRAVAEGAGEDPVERRHQPQAVVEVVLVLVEDGDDVLEVGQRGLQVVSALLDQARQLR